MAIHPHAVQRPRTVALRQRLMLGAGGICLLQSVLIRAGLPGDLDVEFQLDPSLPLVETVAVARAIDDSQLIVVWPTPAGAQVLKLDAAGKRNPTFSTISEGSFGKNSLAVDTAGNIYLASESGDDGAISLRIRRFSSAGVEDAAYTCIIPASALDSLTPLPNGQLMVGAKFGPTTDFTPSMYLHRVLNSGLLDGTFNLQGDWGVFGNVRRVFSKGTTDYVLMGPRMEQVSLNGTREGSFVSAAPKGRPEAMAQTADGGYIVAGRLDAGDGVPRPQVLRLHADGSRDPNFTPTIYAGEVQHLAMDAHGRVLIAGAILEVDGSRKHGLARLNPDGGIDSSFVCDLLPKKGSPAFIIDLTITALGVLGDGRVYVSGNMASRNGVALAQPLMVLENDAPGNGTPQLADLPAKLTLEEGRSLAIQARTTSSGHYSYEWRRDETVLETQKQSLLRIPNIRKSDGGVYRVRVSSATGSDEESIEVDVVPASNHAGDIDSAYAVGGGAGGSNVGANPLLMSRGAAGRLYVAGNFTEFAGISAGPVIALDTRGQMDPAFRAALAVPGLKVREVTALLATPDNELFVAVTLSTSVNGLVDRSTILKLQPNGDPDITFNHPVAFGGSKIVALGRDPSGRLLVARSLSSSPIARLKQSGGNDTSFHCPTFAMEPSGSVQVLSLCAVADKIYVAGTFNKVGDSAVQGIVRLLENGDVDPTYTAQLGGRGPVRKVLPTLEDQVLVALGSPPGLVLLDAEGARVPTFQPPASLVWAVDTAVDSVGRILVVTLDATNQEIPQALVIRLLPDGKSDPSFNAQPGVQPPVALVASDADDALITGMFQDDNGITRSSVVRLHGADRQRVDIRPTLEGRTILRWASRESRKYTIEEASDMNLADWKSVQTVDGTGSLLEWNSGSAVNSRFFRIRLD